MMFSRKKFEKDPGDPFVLKQGGFRDGKLEKYSHIKEWIESSFVPRGQRGEVVGRTFDFSKLRLSGFLIFFFMSILLGRAAWLSIVKGDYYSSMAEGNSVRIERIEAKRGIIYDRNKKPLVRNVANFVISAVPADLPSDEVEKKKELNDLAALIYPGDQEKQGVFSSSTEEKLRKIARGSLESYRSVFLADDIDYDRASLVYLEANKYPGVTLSVNGRRDYLAGEVFSLSHLLGYTGKMSAEDLEKFGDEYQPIDYIGKTGLEYFWEKELKGKNGRRKIEVDALGHEKKILSNEGAEDGRDLVLSLDYDLQKKTEEILSANLKTMKLDRGVAIVMNPNDGEIYSMVSLPSYDNRLFAKGINGEDYRKLSEDESKPLFNRAMAGEYPSGSTVKPVIAAAALQEKVISEKTTFLSTGGLRVGIWFFPDWRAGGHGLTDVRKAIADSVNTFFYYIGGGYEEFNGLGIERLIKYFRLFGLGEQTGIDLPGEATGFVPSKEWKEKVRDERWYIGDTYHLSIGQGDLLVTPLQVASWTAFFANRGKIVKPHLVRYALGDKGELKMAVDESPVKEGIIDDYNIEVVRQGLRRTVTSGSAQRLQSLPVEAAAKTGTAQWNTTKNPHAWFTAFAPYKNPEIVVTVLVEEGKEGSQIGLNVAKEIMQYYFDKVDKK